MKKLIKIGPVLLAIVLFTSCKWLFPPVIPTLPPETQTGEHTFGCYIDGELFVKNNQPRFWGSWLEALYVSIDDDILPKGIEIKCEGINGKTICMFFDKTVTDSNIVINKVSYAGITNYNVSYVYLTRLDTIKAIISGRFEFELNDSINNKKIKFTEGRFDIRNVSVINNWSY